MEIWMHIAYVGEIDPEIVYGAVHIDLKNQDWKKQYHVLSASFILGGKVTEQDKQSGDHKPLG